MTQQPVILGFDIGGTKTAVVLGTAGGEILARSEALTLAAEPFEIALGAMLDAADALLAEARRQGLPAPQVVSAAVGGPLDIERGVIYSPPHLPTWDQAPLKDRLAAHFGLPVFVEHDGNAGALSEFYFGAGRGARSLVYLTMGTGLGAGIILDGRIYRGASDAAGEVGHMRIAEDGPVEYGKAGSWEGYCSGAGLVKLARMRFPDAFPGSVTTYQIVQAALSGEPQAVQLVEEAGAWLGKGVAVLADVLNPELVVVGTLGMVLGDRLLEPARRAMAAEALPVTARACRVVPAQLGRELSSLSALIAAIDAYRSGRLVVGGSPELNRVLETLQAGLAVRRRTIELLAEEIAAGARLLVSTLAAGGKVLACGNGGSAATAGHLVGELVGRYKHDRRPLPGINLSADPSVVTCIGNDYAFEEIFARQVQALARPGDLLVGFTTSGRSANVLKALQAAQEMGVATLVLTGAAGLQGASAGLVLAVPADQTARIQEEHDAILHAWCEILDERFK